MWKNLKKYKSNRFLFLKFENIHENPEINTKKFANFLIFPLNLVILKIKTLKKLKINL